MYVYMCKLCIYVYICMYQNVSTGGTQLPTCSTANPTAKPESLKRNHCMHVRTGRVPRPAGHTHAPHGLPRDERAEPHAGAHTHLRGRLGRAGGSGGYRDRPGKYHSNISTYFTLVTGHKCVCVSTGVGWRAREGVVLSFPFLWVGVCAWSMWTPCAHAHPAHLWGWLAGWGVRGTAATIVIAQSSFA